MTRPLRLLALAAEDRAPEAWTAALAAAGWRPVVERVANREAARAALAAGRWELALVAADSAPRALDPPLAGEIPWLAVAETFEASTAVEWLRAGAADCVALEDLATAVARVLDRARRSAMRDDTAIAGFARRAAHDLNNLLTVIQGYGDLLVEDLAGDPDLQPTAEELVVAALRVSDLSARLQALGRQCQPPSEALRLADFLAGRQATLAARLGDAIRLECRAEDGELATFASPEDLDRILSELLANAAEAMPEGGRITVVARLSDAVPAELEPGPYCLLRVEDGGRGFAAEILAAALRPFVTTKPRQQGAGLGLSIVDYAARQLGGAVRLETSPGQGSAVEVYLPLAEA